MGSCSSCLGLGRRDRRVENPETCRLLYDDPYRSQYGATGQTQHRAQYYQPDPEAIRREREALEGICHDMSDEVLDVFTSLPQSGRSNSNLNSPPAIFTDGGPPMVKLDEDNTTTKNEPASPKNMYRSVRAAPSAGHIWRDLSGDPKKWEEAKAVMEGPGERG